MSITGVGGSDPTNLNPTTIPATTEADCSAGPQGTVVRGSAPRNPIAAEGVVATNIDISVPLRAYDHIADALVTAAGADGVISRSDAKAHVRQLRREGKYTEALATSFLYKFIDHRDHKPGARVTAADFNGSRSYVQAKLLERLDVNSDGGLDRGERDSLSRTAKLLVRLGQDLASIARPDVGGMPPNYVDEPYVEAFGNAVVPLGGADPALTEEVTLAQVPVVVSGKLAVARDEINGRTFHGTDYVAELEGFYKIFASETDRTVVGYAAFGWGSGEPDYHDGIVIGFSVEGDRVHHAIDNG